VLFPSWTKEKKRGGLVGEESPLSRIGKGIGLARVCCQSNGHQGGIRVTSSEGGDRDRAIFRGRRNNRTQSTQQIVGEGKMKLAPTACSR